MEHTGEEKRDTDKEDRIVGKTNGKEEQIGDNQHILPYHLFPSATSSLCYSQVCAQHLIPLLRMKHGLFYFILVRNQWHSADTQTQKSDMSLDFSRT